MTPDERMKKDIDILARTIWGEARGEGPLGMENVASTILNRVKFAQARGGYWWGNTIAEVCLEPWQFSCWNADDPNRVKMEMVDASDPAFRVALGIASKAANGHLADRTGGATHYHTRAVRPAWRASGQHTASLGAHEFYKGIA